MSNYPYLDNSKIRSTKPITYKNNNIGLAYSSPLTVINGELTVAGFS
jgi:hypothetical protein